MLANVTWPALMYYERERAWWIIISTVLLEFLILRRSLNTSAARALGVTAAINVSSAVVGTLSGFVFKDAPLLPLTGLYWEAYVNEPLDWGTFNRAAWVATILCAALISTVVEGFVLFTVFYRVSTWRCLFWLPMANLASAELTYYSLRVFWPY